MLVAAMAATMAMAGCNRDAAPAVDPVEPAVEAPVIDTPPDAPAEPEAVKPDAAPVAAPTPFDVGTVAVSDASLGEWPYIAAPEGYEFTSARTLDLSQVPFWTGQMLQPVEGKVFEARLHAASEKTYSRFEVLKRFDEALTALGAQKINQSEVPGEVINEQLPKDFGVEFNAGSGGYYGGQEVSTYVLRQADRAVWYKLYSDGNGGSVLVAESDQVPTGATPAAP